MMRKLAVFFLVFAVVMAFSLTSLAQEKIEGKIEALNNAAKTITINGTEYSLGNKAAQVKVKVGDMVQATVEENTVTKLQLLM